MEVSHQVCSLGMVGHCMSLGKVLAMVAGRTFASDSRYFPDLMCSRLIFSGEVQIMNLHIT
jgi:hypothetical protein